MPFLDLSFYLLQLTGLIIRVLFSLFKMDFHFWFVPISGHDLDTAYEHYQELAGDLKDNPEFLEHYIYLLRELGYFEEAKVKAQVYLKLVPDDVQMQELIERL